MYGKELKVRRLDDGNTEWIWYCTLLRKWIKYGDKVGGYCIFVFVFCVSLLMIFNLSRQDSKGNASPVKSSDIEKQYQSNPKSSFTFSAGGETFEIKFTGEDDIKGSFFYVQIRRRSFSQLVVSFYLLLAMQQVGKKKKRKVTRRPLYRQQQAGAG